MAGTVAGCGAAQDPLGIAIGDVAGASSSAALALEEHTAGQLTGPVTRTLVDDAVQEAADAGRQLASLDVSGGQIAVQEAALQEATSAVHRLHEARRALNGEQAAQVAAQLRTAASVLDDLRRRAEQQR